MDSFMQMQNIGFMMQMNQMMMEQLSGQMSEMVMRFRDMFNWGFSLYRYYVFGSIPSPQGQGWASVADAEEKIEDPAERAAWELRVKRRLWSMALAAAAVALLQVVLRRRAVKRRQAEAWAEALTAPAWESAFAAPRVAG